MGRHVDVGEEIMHSGAMDFLLPSLFIALAFFVQTTAGFGSGLIAYPLMLGVLSVKDAAGLMSLYYLLFSMIMIWPEFKRMDKRVVLELGLASVVGMVIGTLLLDLLGDLDILKRLTGVFVIAYVAYSQFKKTELTVMNHLGPVFGFIGGFSSGLFSAGGHFFVIYASSKVRGTDALRATIIGALAIMNVTRLPVMLGTGLVNWEVAKMSLVVLPAFVLSLVAGHFFYNKVNKRLVKELIMGLLFVVGVKLIVG